jgi:hypothetical protein
MVRLTETRRQRRIVAQRIVLCAITAGLLLPAALVADAPGQDLTERFLLLATTKTGTMEEELTEAAAAGYRILAGSPTSGDEMVLILEKVATPPDVYEYQLLATTRTGTMQEEIEEAAGRGFRILPSTMISKAQMFGGDEIVLVMEKAPNSAVTYEYRLLATNRTSTMQEEMDQAMVDGFSVVGLASRGEHVVIVEKLIE